jgi:hypothetical protein
MVMRYDTRAEAIGLEVLEGLAAGYLATLSQDWDRAAAVCREYDVDGIAEEVLGDRGQGFARVVDDDDDFWEIAERHEIDTDAVRVLTGDARPAPCEINAYRREGSGDWVVWYAGWDMCCRDEVLWAPSRRPYLSEWNGRWELIATGSQCGECGRYGAAPWAETVEGGAAELVGAAKRIAAAMKASDEDKRGELRARLEAGLREALAARPAPGSSQDDWETWRGEYHVFPALDPVPPGVMEADNGSLSAWEWDPAEGGLDSDGVNYAIIEVTQADLGDPATP